MLFLPSYLRDGVPFVPSPPNPRPDWLLPHRQVLEQWLNHPHSPSTPWTIKPLNWMKSDVLWTSDAYSQTTALQNCVEGNKNYNAGLQICPSNHLVQCSMHQYSPVQCSSMQHSVWDLSDSQESHQYWLPMEGSRIVPTRNLHLLQLLPSHKLQPKESHSHHLADMS